MKEIKIIQIINDKTGDICGLGNDNRLYVFDYSDWYVYGNELERLSFAGKITQKEPNI